MKQRFSSLDLQIITSELRSILVGHRLSNIYDLSSRIFLLKFALPDSKHLVVIDSGFRVHLTSFTRETSPTPSSFVAKLRKHLRTRRLTAVNQLGVDRVLDLVFSDGAYHLYLEFFAGGNVILTDKDGKMISVLRIVSAGEDGRGGCRVGEVYDTSGKDIPPPVSKERVVDALKDAVDAATKDEQVPEPERVKRGKFQKKKKKGDNPLKRVLGNRMPQFSPVLVEHSLLSEGVDATVKAEGVLANEELLGKVVKSMLMAERVMKDLTSGEGVRKGYIIAREPKAKSLSATISDAPKKAGISFESAEAVEREQPEKVQEEGEAKGWVFDDFVPFLPEQFKNTPGVKTLEFEGFNKTVDTFFSSIEAQKLESRIRDREETAAKRLEGARQEHARRIEALRDVQDINVRKAQAIEANQQLVEGALTAVNDLIAQGMDWVAMARFIEIQQKQGNPLAELIKLPLKLYENIITLKLHEADWEPEEDADESEEEDDDEDDGDDDEETPSNKKPLIIDINLALSAFANARTYYDQKRSAADKEVKTITSSTKALKSTEKKVASDLKKSLKTEKQVLRPVRKALWFEKFLFFISSDGYLVLGGRDAQQNEHIYKRHFRRGDIYVHADIHGAATVIVKNNPSTPNALIPPSTLQQAGQLSVCTSQAWDSKAVLSAWWVGFDQVSKTAPTGEYLTTGSFMIRGKKNFLPPAQLILGYGVLWRVDEESKKKHVRHRVDERKDDEVEKAAEEAFAKEGSQPEPAVLGEMEEEKSQEEDSEGEEFPDTKIESAREDSDEEFPDTKVDSEDSGSEAELETETQEGSTAAAPTGSNKYDLESSSAATAVEASVPSSTENLKTKAKRLSAKQRRDLKKGRPLTPSQPTSQDTTRSSTPNPSLSSTTAPKGPQPRGKRAKAKRAAQKYANQDDEDRALALSLLGVNIGGSAAAADSSENAENAKETAEARKARLREQHKRAQAVGLAEEARRQAEDEEDDDLHDVATTPLDAFIPDPYDDDVLLDAIPVCAPWGAMGKYKCRVKMQPGTQKKGKAVRGVWSQWIAEKGLMKGAERELVAGWKEAEIVNCVGVGKLKVFGSAETGGGSKGKGGGGKGKGKGKK